MTLQEVVCHTMLTSWTPLAINIQEADSACLISQTPAARCQ